MNVSKQKNKPLTMKMEHPEAVRMLELAKRRLKRRRRRATRRRARKVRKIKTVVVAQTH